MIRTFTCLPAYSIRAIFHNNRQKAVLAKKNISIRAEVGPYLLLSLLLVAQMLQAQTRSWNGSISADWHTADNWTPSGAPTAGNHVIIFSAPNAPVITAAVVANSVHVQTGGSLIIQATGSLAINGFFDHGNGSTAGFRNQGTVSNNGQLVIGSTADVGALGILNDAVFNNNSGGEISINRSTNTGLSNQFGTFNNASKINIGAIANVGLGLLNGAIFNNNNGGEISIDRSYTGMYNGVNGMGTFTNAAKITFGANSSAGSSGLVNDAAFNNNSGGKISIDRTISAGLFNTGGTFSNKGEIVIGSIAGVGVFGLHNLAVFNNSGGEISIDRSSSSALYNKSGTFSNTGEITIGALAGVGSDGILNVVNATFQNSTCIALINIVANAIINNSGAFDNAGSIIENAGSNSNISTNTGVVQNLNGGTFTIGSGNAPLTTAGDIWTGCVDNYWATTGNWHDGSVPTATDHTIIPTATNASVITAAAAANSVHVQTGAFLTIQATGSLTINGFFDHGNESTSGFRNQGTVSNNGDLVLGSSTSIGNYGLWNQATFNNNGEINIDRSVIRSLYNTEGTFTNAGEIIIGANSSVGDCGLFNEATFNNYSGEISIDHSTGSGLWASSGTFTNTAKITIGANNNVGHFGLFNMGVFNNSEGEINIDRFAFAGLYNRLATFGNDAKITIGAIADLGLFGLWNEAPFQNNTCAKIYQYAPLYNTNTLTNNGLMFVSTTGSHNNMALTNNGIIAYPQSNPIPNVINNEIIISPLTFDGCGAVSPAFSLGNPLDLTIDGIYTDAAATTSAGAYSATSNTFTPNPALTEDTYDLFVKIDDVVGACTRIVPWQLTIQNCPLPITLISFDARTEENTAQLHWTNSDETNVSHFEVQRSVDGKRFDAIGRVEARGVSGGDTDHRQNRPESYSFTDRLTPDISYLTPVTYYRLKMTDYDGTYAFSPIRSVRFENIETFFQIHPNPVADMLHINADGAGSLVLYNAAGIRVYSIDGPLRRSIDVKNLPSGIYILQVTKADRSVRTQRLVIHK